MGRSLRLVVRVLRGCLLMGLLLASAQEWAGAQTAAAPDTDKDGLSDTLEQALLEQFKPEFFVGRADCSNVPAEFVPGDKVPTVKQEDGTIYGQVFPSARSTAAMPMAEIHFYHLWRSDCGAHGHHLDTEHVAVLVHASSKEVLTATWKADYWYAAAHENTVCDVSQISRASTLHAEDHGAKVWISPGKHASYLNETLCHRGCGADRCEEMVALAVPKVVNLGEIGHAANGSVFAASAEWPLKEKMGSSNFADEPLARLATLPPTDIAWVRPGKHPVQGVIAHSASTEGALANSGQDTSDAISLADDKTGNALGTGYRKTKHALGTAFGHVGKALGAKSPQDQ